MSGDMGTTKGYLKGPQQAELKNILAKPCRRVDLTKALSKVRAGS